MKRRKILLLILTLSVLTLCSCKEKPAGVPVPLNTTAPTETVRPETRPTEAAEGTEATKAPVVPAPTEPKLDLNTIPGYRNGTGETVCGLTLPYEIPNTPLQIVGMGQYTGPFVEDGKDAPTANALALVIYNPSEDFAEYLELHFWDVNYDERVFRVTNIPAGKNVLCLEQNGAEFHPEELLSYADALYSVKQDLSMQSDRLEVYAEDGALTVKNISADPIGTVYVRYKTQLGPLCYLGGITYSCKLENVAPGGEVTEKTQHFSENSSQIVMVEAVD